MSRNSSAFGRMRIRTGDIQQPMEPWNTVALHQKKANHPESQPPPDPDRCLSPRQVRILR